MMVIQNKSEHEDFYIRSLSTFLLIICPGLDQRREPSGAIRAERRDLKSED